MGKLQPNFSWQKYQGHAQDQQEQFQYQLQQQHIVTANAINTTVDDLSYWLRERPTAMTWIDSREIFTKTFPVNIDSVNVWAGGTVCTIPLGISGDFTVIDMTCCISDGTLSSSNTLLLPHIDVSTPANEISITRAGTNVVLTSGGTNRSGYSGYLTVYYVKS